MGNCVSSNDSERVHLNKSSESSHKKHRKGKKENKQKNKRDPGLVQPDPRSSMENQQQRRSQHRGHPQAAQSSWSQTTPGHISLSMLNQVAKSNYLIIFVYFKMILNNLHIHDSFEPQRNVIWMCIVVHNDPCVCIPKSHISLQFI